MVKGKVEIEILFLLLINFQMLYYGKYFQNALITGGLQNSKLFNIFGVYYTTCRSWYYILRRPYCRDIIRGSIVKFQLQAYIFNGTLHQFFKTKTFYIRFECIFNRNILQNISVFKSVVRIAINNKCNFTTQFVNFTI